MNANRYFDDLNIGFELEAVFPWHEGSEGGGPNGFGSYSSILAHAYQTIPLKISRYFRDKLSLKPDASIDPTLPMFRSGGKMSKNPQKYGSGIEIITSPVRGRRVLQLYRELRNAVTECGGYMNESCALHVNVSFFSDHETNNVDYSALCIQHRQEFWLSEYSRTDNQFCPATMSLKPAPNTLPWSFETLGQAEGMVKMSDFKNAILETSRRVGKNHAIVDRGVVEPIGGRYFEFRIAGGSEAILNPTMTEDYIIDIAHILRISKMKE